MKVNVEELSAIERKLSIEVESARVAEELDRAYAALGRQVKVAGFRPGKIPRRILEQKFKGDVENDVIRRVVESAYLSAIRDHNVEAVGSPEVTPGDFSPNAPFSFQAKVEVKPKFEAKDYRGLSLNKHEVSVGDEQINERLERLRDNLSRLEPVTDRDITQRGDFATVDYEAKVDGKDFPGSKAESVTVEVAPGELVESKIAALEGVKVGEVKEIDYAFPPDYSVEEVKGKVGRFKLQVKGLKTKIIPELNDELAKETGGGETLEELKARIKEDLERAEKGKQAGEERDELFAQLISKNAFEVPKAMIERALDMMLQGALRMMARSGVDPRMLNLDFTQLRGEMRAKAETEVKGTLLLEAISEQEKIEVSDEEVDKRIEKIAEEAKQGLAQVRKQFKGSDQRESLKLRIREEKTVEWLKANARSS